MLNYIEIKDKTEYSMRRYFITVILILILLTSFSINLYANSPLLIVSIVEFKNASGYEDYAFLSKAFQNSIFDSLNDVRGTELVDRETANNSADEYKLSIDNYNNKRIILKYSAKAKSNIIILGEYSIEGENRDRIKVKALLYSVAQMEVIDDISLTGSINNSYDLVDEIAKKALDTFIEKQELLQISIEEIMEQVKPAKIITPPSITKVDENGIKIEWVTDKETASYIYISPNENIAEDSPQYEDMSIDAVNHYIILDYNAIDINSEYYIKSTETDFFDNTTESEKIHIEKKHIYNRLYDNYKQIYDEFSKEVREKVDNENIEEALDIIYEKTEILNNYINLLELSGSEKDSLEKIDEVVKRIVEGDKQIENMNLGFAVEQYEEALTVHNNDIEDFIPIKIIETKLNNTQSTMRVLELVQEADSKLDENDYKKARESYREALNIIDNNSNVLYSKSELLNKMESIPDTIYKFYLDASLGSMFGIIPIGTVTPNLTWNMTFNIRLSRLFTIGVGFDFLFLDTHLKFSPINTNGLYIMTHELYIKGGFLTDFKPITSLIIGYETEWGIGAMIGVGYIWSYEMIGVSAEIKAWTMYHENRVREQMPVNLALSIGFILNLGYDIDEK